MTMPFLRSDAPSLVNTRNLPSDVVCTSFTRRVFAMMLSAMTGVAFGLLPALHASRIDLNDALKQGGGRSGAGGRRSRLRSALVVSEIAVALTLLIGASLMIQTFAHLRTLDPGFRPILASDPFEAPDDSAPWPEDPTTLYYWRATFWRARLTDPSP